MAVLCISLCAKMEINIMEEHQDKGLVSIIVLSHGDSTHIVETVKSILVYQVEV